MFKFYLRTLIPCVAAVLCILAAAWLFWHGAYYRAALAALGSALVCGICDAVIKDARAGIPGAGIPGDVENPEGKKHG